MNGAPIPDAAPEEDESVSLAASAGAAPDLIASREQTRLDRAQWAAIAILIAVLIAAVLGIFRTLEEPPDWATDAVTMIITAAVAFLFTAERNKD